MFGWELLFPKVLTFFRWIARKERRLHPILGTSPGIAETRRSMESLR
jgi:hypothetical protein